MACSTLIRKLASPHRSLQIALIALLAAHGAAFGQIALGLSSASAAPGSTVTLNVSLSSAAGSAPAGLQWTFTYSDALVATVSAQAGPAAVSAGKSISCSGAPGAYQCLIWGMNTSPIPNGVVATITLGVSGAASGTAALQLDSAVGASAAGSSVPATATGGALTILSSANTLNSVACSPASLVTPATATCTVTLKSAVWSATSVDLSLGANSAPLTIPASVSIAAGSASGTFSAQAASVSTAATGIIVASFGGGSASFSLALAPPSSPLTLSCSPVTVATPGSATCTVTILSAAPTGGTAIAVSLASATPGITLPSSVTVPAGSKTVNFQVQAAALAAAVSNSVKATLNGNTQSASLNFQAMTGLRVNAGGPAYTDGLGRVWTADNGATGGTPYSVTSAISGTTTPALYQTERYGTFQYQFAVPNGSYTVNLKFAELYFTATGQRRFNVAINGNTVLTNFDVVAAAGGGLKAVDKAFPVGVTNGQIAIQFIPVLSTPTVNAIEIVPQSGVGVSVTPGNVSLGAAQAQQFTATVTGNANTGVKWSISPLVGAISGTGLYTAPANVTQPQTVTVTATSTADMVTSGAATIKLGASGSLRINAGGPAYTDSSARLWNADIGFTGGDVYSSSSVISGTSTPALYQTERFGAFQYQLAVSNGTYTVNLKFAELYFNSAGQRQFTVAINGTQVLENFDVVASAGGGLKAIDKPFPVVVTNGQIAIDFVAVISTPTVNAIEIVPVTIDPVSVTLTGSQTQQFTAAVSGFADTAVTWSLSSPVGNLSSTGVYTAPATILNNQTVLVTATSVADPTSSASAAVNLLGSTGIRVNAGGPNYTDPLGRLWSADNGSSTGSTYSVTSAISGTSTPTLYQTERYGTFQYQFAVPDGDYAVNLKFAELYFTATGQRQFNVKINGKKVLTNFDVVAAAGGGLKAVDRSFPVTVAGGQLTIQFIPVVSTPTVNAIEILPQTGTSVSLSPATVALGPSQTQQFTATAGSQTPTVNWSIYPALGTISASGLYTAPPTITQEQTVTVTDLNSSTSASISLTPAGSFRINAGGPDYTDSQGQLWSADKAWIGGSVYSVTSPIVGTTTPALYQTERYGTFQYQLTVPNGDYTVKLKFAELYFTVPAQRLFHVKINGTQVLTNFDVVAAAGRGLKAVDKTFPVTVSDSQILIELIPVLSTPTLNAIEIFQ